MTLEEIIGMLGSATPTSAEMARMNQSVNPAMGKSVLTDLEIAKMGKPSLTEASRMQSSLSPVDQYRQMMESIPMPVSNMEADAMAGAMAGRNAGLSLPANEMMPNFADGQMPLYSGGLLENMQGNMVDPQELMNRAYDMSAPREMRIDAINRLRQLGVM